MATLRVVSNQLPEYIAEFPIKVQSAMGEACEAIKELWRWDVRVSQGSGNYDGSQGGDSGHYRDNVFVDQQLAEDGEAGWVIWTPVPYSVWNEFGGGPLEPRPSAQMAAEQGTGLIEQAYQREFGG